MATVLTKSGSPPSADGTNSPTESKGPNINVSSETLSSSIPSLGIAVAERRFWFQRAKSYDPTAIATQVSVFDDPDTAEKYQPRPDWENIHRFDPLERWTWGEEHRLIRKIDWRIMVWACIMFMALELDRANIGQALTDNFLGDLHMTTNDYNLGNSIFKLAFLCAELPSQLVSKWMGPDRWIPSQMVLWSIVATAQFWLQGRTSFLACRALLGILQGGFIPDVILYLSYFYKHHELSLRLGFFWTAMSIADIASALLAYGLLHMRGVQGHAGWSRFRGKNGWFTEKEEKIIVNRVIREDPSKSDMHNREPITPRLLWQSLKDFDLWPIYILGLVFQMPMAPIGQYLTLTLRGLHFDTFQANLLTIPYTVIHMITMLGITYLGEIFNELTLIAASGQVWALPFLIYLNSVDTAGVNRWVIYAVTTLLLGYPNAHPIQVGWNSRNSNTVRSRTVSAACYNMFVQAGGIVSSNIYRKDDAPLYRRANKQLLAICCMNIALYVLVKAYYLFRNKQKARKWEAMTTEERLAYLATTTDKGNKRLDFRFQH
ncbi:major facilitator superfamily domain-containing protein [Neurospora intermedia]|uniref:Major facilitator superfamily domain-containing protein n=1 Tax=Neurospora intermedia TaxID=5142 RepID=A0ABR3D0M4_NEUIN